MNWIIIRIEWFNFSKIRAGPVHGLIEKCILLQMWTDCFLTWRPEDYGGIENVRFPIEAIWRPDIVLWNRLEDQDYSGDRDEL